MKHDYSKKNQFFFVILFFIFVVLSQIFEMTTSAGFFCFDPNLMLYNTISKAIKTVAVEKLDENDINSIVKFFDCLKRSSIKDPIDFLCVTMNGAFTNKFRQNFIEKAKEFGIKNVRIIDIRISDLCGAISHLSFMPKHGDVIWILAMSGTHVFMDAWKFHKIHKWQFDELHTTKKSQENENHSSTVVDLKNIKKQLKLDYGVPYILCIDGFKDLNFNDFAEIFPFFTKLKFLKGYSAADAALSYARFLSNEKEFLKYETKLISGKNIIIRVNNQIRCEIDRFQILPFSTTLETYVKRDDLVTIGDYENIALSVNVKDDGIYVMDLSFDINGIYTLNVKHWTVGTYMYMVLEQNQLEASAAYDGEDDQNNAKVEINQQQTRKIAKEQFNADVCTASDGVDNSSAKVVTSQKQAQNIEPEKNKYSIPLKTSEYDASLNAFGIDLGTTECCAAVIRKYGPYFFVQDPMTALRTMPSYIGFFEIEPKCGQVVVNRMRHEPKYAVFDIKRIIGKNFGEVIVDSLWPFKVTYENEEALIEHSVVNGTDKKSPEELTAILVNYIKNVCENQQSQKFSEVVISIPSEFSEAQITATKNAVEYAGFEKVHFIPEPIAAAFAYFSEIDIPNQSNILICDCGGGTIDVCVAKVADDQLIILNSNGDSFLGGRDFDKILFNHFDAILKHKFGIDVTVTSKRYVLKQKCQDIKKTLSAATQDWLYVSDFDPESNEQIEITRQSFEEMTTEILLKIKNVVLQAIIQAKIKKPEIHYVFQVGGGCRMPMIKNLLADIFPEAHHQCNLYPDWVVAHGAALYAYYLKHKNLESHSNTSKNKPQKPPSSPKELDSQPQEQSVKNSIERDILVEVNKIKLVAADITKLKVDAIVNAARQTLLGGGGVDGAIHEAAGPQLLEECKTLNGCEVGQAKSTKAYNIKNAKFIIHTVGPRIKFRRVTEVDEANLYNCYMNSLIVAMSNKMQSIAFPTISTGSYRYPKEAAAKVATKAVKDFLKTYSNEINEIIFCVFEEEDKKIYQKLIPTIFQ